MALKFHPDKLDKHDTSAGEMFQKILSAYNILKDPSKREIYDRTGVVCDKDPSTITQFVEAYQYYRQKFPELREKDIEQFEQKYRFSQDEEKDLLEFFKDNEGDVTYILHNIILSRNEDIWRFVEFLEKMVESPEHAPDLLPFAATFKKTRRKIRKLSNKEAMEAEKIKEDRLASLRQAILLKRQSRGQGFLEHLEEAFVNAPAKKGKRILKDNKKVANQGKRKSPNFLPVKQRATKKVKKVNVGAKKE